MHLRPASNTRQWSSLWLGNKIFLRRTLLFLPTDTDEERYSTQNGHKLSGCGSKVLLCCSNCIHVGHLNCHTCPVWHIFVDAVIFCLQITVYVEQSTWMLFPQICVTFLLVLYNKVVSIKDLNLCGLLSLWTCNREPCLSYTNISGKGLSRRWRKQEGILWGLIVTWGCQMHQRIQ